MNAQMITNIHEDIVNVLLGKLERNPRSIIITYSDLCKEIDNQTDSRNVASYLGDISCWCAEIGAPMLSAVVINNKSNRPGKGFFRLYSEIYEENVKAADEERVFIEEYKKIIKYDHWDDLKLYLGI